MNIFRLWLLFCGLLVYACGTPSATRVGEGQNASTRAIIDEIRNTSSQDYSAVTILSSQASPYSTFKLMSPPRIIIDMKAEPEINLKKLMKVQDGLIDSISVGERAGPAGTTRIIVHLSKEDFEYNIKSEGNQLLLKVSPVSPKPVIQQAPPPQPATAAVVEAPGPGLKPAAEGPRIFFRPGPSPLTQVLGVDFFLREGARSRLTITTSKKVGYDVRKEGPERLIIDLQDATIPPLLMKRLATQYFEGAVERIKAFSPSEDRKVSLEVLLRESVPYKVTQEEGVLNIDFGPSTKKPRPVGLRLDDQRPPSDSTGKTIDDESAARTYEITTREYAGKKMSFDFADTDIRNVLKLIAEVADLNIVWGSDVEGKISMKLEDVPWDQALEMVLKPNGLTYQIEDSVIWVVPKARLIDMEMKERDRKGALLAQKRLQGIFETKILEYIKIRHRKAQDIFRMLVGDDSAVPPIRGVLDIEEGESKEQEKGEKEKGKESKLKVKDVYLTYDPETNMIIVNGVRSKVDKVKDIVAKLDVPQKQVMIEARIVEATTSFSRDVGIKWDTTFKSGDVTTKFATNFPKMPTDVSALTLGYANAALTTVINAQIALAETDGRLTTLSAPKIITRDAATATIKQGTQIAVPTGKDNFGNIIYSMADAVLELKVTPKITANDMVVMTIDVKDDYPDYTNVQPMTESVPIKTKSARTETIVASGETLVIGGIYKEDKSFTREGVPWLSEIPILGWLFRFDEQKVDKIELLIFLTPRVLKAGPKEI